MHSTRHELILASASPRRKQLLEETGFKLTVFPIKVSEKLKKNLNLEDQIKDLAERKMQYACKHFKPLKSQDYLMITADTMVTLDAQALGKPENKSDAEQMLTRLSGRSHIVKTAICVYESISEKYFCEIDSTEVHFRPISRQEILDYIESGEPMDKAGAYAIQGQGGSFVQKYNGAYDNVVGFPRELFKKILIENNWLKFLGEEQVRNHAKF